MRSHAAAFALSYVENLPRFGVYVQVHVILEFTRNIRGDDIHDIPGFGVGLGDPTRWREDGGAAFTE
jgi:hypothetical protein